MIKENSGKIYRFRLEHELGFGFGEVYDFTDHSEFDGRILYVFNRLDAIELKDYNLEEIAKTGIVLGPIRLVSFPGTRGKYASKFIGQRNDFLITEIPVTKELRDILPREKDWSKFADWYRSDYYKQGDLKFLEYKEVRDLETRILNHISGVSTKFSMKILIDNDKKITDYYDLEDIGNLNLFLQLINTYYPLGKARKLLNDIDNIN